MTTATPAARLIVGSPDRVGELVAAMIDPVNRVYRYPLVRWMLPRVARTAVTPAQVTALHTALGLAAALAVLVGGAPALVVAGVLWELHLVLDCLDGALARARGTTTERGRTLDILGDSVAYVALAAALAVHLRATAPHVPAVALAATLIASGGLAAWAYEFHLRKLTAALVTATDPIYEDLRVKHRAIRAGRAGFVVWFGYAFDWLQIIGLQPGTRRDIARRLAADAPLSAPSAEIRHIVAAAATPRGRRALRAVSLMSNDNNVTIVGVGLLSGHVVAAEALAIAWASVTLVVGVAACRAFLRPTPEAA